MQQHTLGFKGIDEKLLNIINYYYSINVTNYYFMNDHEYPVHYWKVASFCSIIILKLENSMIIVRRFT